MHTYMSGPLLSWPIVRVMWRVRAQGRLGGVVLDEIRASIAFAGWSSGEVMSYHFARRSGATELLGCRLRGPAFVFRRVGGTPPSIL